MYYIAFSPGPSLFDLSTINLGLPPVLVVRYSLSDECPCTAPAPMSLVSANALAISGKRGQSGFSENELIYSFTSSAPDSA